MIKSNIFYLFVVAIFLTLSALSFYWFNNVDSYSNTHRASENPILESSANIWYKFNSVLSFLDIIGNNSSEESKDINMLSNPIEKSTNVLSSFEINNQLEQEAENVNETASFNELLEEKEVKDKKWYKKYSEWISQKGLYTFKKENVLELGWQNYQGKTYTISIPY